MEDSLTHQAILQLSEVNCLARLQIDAIFMQRRNYWNECNNAKIHVQLLILQQMTLI